MTELTEAFISWVFLNYRGPDEFWAAYQKFQNDPYLVVYVPLSRAEVQEVFREGGKSLPFALPPSLQCPSMFMRKPHYTCLCP